MVVGWCSAEERRAAARQLRVERARDALQQVREDLQALRRVRVRAVDVLDAKQKRECGQPAAHAPLEVGVPTSCGGLHRHMARVCSDGGRTCGWKV